MNHDHLSPTQTSYKESQLKIDPSLIFKKIIIN
jgi:hypothetical protein